MASPINSSQQYQLITAKQLTELSADDVASFFDQTTQPIDESEDDFSMFKKGPLQEFEINHIKTVVKNFLNTQPSAHTFDKKQLNWKIMEIAVLFNRRHDSIEKVVFDILKIA